MSSCLSLVVTAVTAVFLGSTPAVFLTPISSESFSSSASASAFSSASVFASSSASVFASATPPTPTATATVSYEFSYRPDAFDPESVCEDRSAFIKYIPCTNTVELAKKNIYDIIYLDADRFIESDTWQIPGDKNEYAHISYLGIPLQVISASVHISATMNCTTIEDYHGESRSWSKYTTSPITVEYSELPTYENVWFKFTRPAAVQKTDVCQVKMYLSGRGTVYLEMDHLDISFDFGLIT